MGFHDLQFLCSLHDATRSLSVSKYGSLGQVLPGDRQTVLFFPSLDDDLGDRDTDTSFLAIGAKSRGETLDSKSEYGSKK